MTAFRCVPRVTLSLLLLGIIVGLTDSRGAIAADELQTPRREVTRKPRPPRTAAQQLERLSARAPAENPLVPAMMLSIERYLQNQSDLSDMDRLLRDNLQKNPRITRARLTEALNNWKALPASVRTRITPPEMRSLTVRDKLDFNTLRQVFRASASRRGEMSARRPNVGTRPQAPRAEPPKSGPNLKFDTTIKTIQPASAYPGGKATISGFIFTKLMLVHIESVDQTDVQTHTFPAAGPAVTFVDTGKLEITIPQTVAPGKYRVGIKKTASGPVASNWAEFTVSAPRYRVKFNTIRCIDESDPEVNGDEIVTESFGFVEPNYTWHRVTGEYTGFGEDGANNPERPYKEDHQWQFLTDGKSAPVRQNFELGVSLFEWDSGDVEDAVDAFNVAAAIAGGIVGALNAPAGVIVGVVLSGIGQIVALFGNDPDPLGTRVLAWSAAELQTLTANKSRVDDFLFFQNSDDEGSYRVSYSIFREQP